MNLIVFDLEWNIGYQPKTFLYHGAELTLRGEIIQIGAVRINARGDVLDTFEVNLRPRIFRKLQHHIAKVTGLSQGDLDAGLPMREGLQKFLDWAGPDAELAEWGLDDVPVLKQNLFLVGLDENWPDRWYDLQRIFLQAYPRREGEGLTLESVVDRLGIPKVEPFHNALDDALYTAKICRKLPLAEGLATYPTEEELLTEALLGSEKTGCDVQLFMNRLEHDDYRNLPELYKANCPKCGAPLPHIPMGEALLESMRQSPEGTVETGEPLYEQDLEEDRIDAMSQSATTAAMLLFAIPIAGFVLAVVWSFGGTQDPARRRLARAYLIRALVVTGLVILFVAVAAMVFTAALHSQLAYYYYR